MAECRRRNGEWPKSLVFSLACLLKFYQEQDVSDDPKTVAFIREHDIEEILGDSNLWGMDLSECGGLVRESMKHLETDVCEAVQWAIL